MKRSWRHTYYDKPLQHLSQDIVERIVQASRKFGEDYSMNNDWVTFSWICRETHEVVSYAEYNKMRYEHLVETLVPEGFTEEQIATWDLSIDDIFVRESLHFIPTYNLLVRAKLAQPIEKVSVQCRD